MSHHCHANWEVTRPALLPFSTALDTAARYSGDEFAVVLPETGAEAVSQVAHVSATALPMTDGTGAFCQYRRCSLSP